MDVRHCVIFVLLFSSRLVTPMTESTQHPTVTTSTLSPLLADKLATTTTDSRNTTSGVHSSTNISLPTDPSNQMSLSTKPLIEMLLSNESTISVSSSTNMPTDISSSINQTNDMPSSPKVSADMPSSTTLSVDMPSSTKLSVDMPSSTKLSADMPSSTTLSVDMPSSTKLLVDMSSSTKLSAAMPSSTTLSVDMLSSTTLSVDMPSSTKLSADMPSSTKLSTDMPSSTKLSADMPSSTKLSTDMPSSTKLSADMLSSTKLSTDMTSSTKLSGDIPFSTKQSTDMPSSTKLSADMPSSTKQSTYMPLSTKLPSDIPSSTNQTDNMFPSTKSSSNLPDMQSSSKSPLSALLSSIGPNGSSSLSSLSTSNLLQTETGLIPSSTQSSAKSPPTPSTSASGMFSTSWISAPSIPRQTRSTRFSDLLTNPVGSTTVSGPTGSTLAPSGLPIYGGSTDTSGGSHAGFTDHLFPTTTYAFSKSSSIETERLGTVGPTDSAAISSTTSYWTFRPTTMMTWYASSASAAPTDMSGTYSTTQSPYTTSKPLIITNYTPRPIFSTSTVPGVLDKVDDKRTVKLAVGICLGILCLLGIIAIVLFFIRKHKKKGFLSFVRKIKTTFIKEKQVEDKEKKWQEEWIDFTPGVEYKEGSEFNPDIIYRESSVDVENAPYKKNPLFREQEAEIAYVTYEEAEPVLLSRTELKTKQNLDDTVGENAKPTSVEEKQDEQIRGDVVLKPVGESSEGATEPVQSEPTEAGETPTELKLSLCHDYESTAV